MSNTTVEYMRAQARRNAKAIRRARRTYPRDGNVSSGRYKGGEPDTVVSDSRALPPSMLITAAFSEQGFLTSGGTTAVRQWTPNSFYDCQPATGGNKWNDYDQWSALYTEYRVLSYRFKFELTNTEGPAYPVQIYILQTDANPGTTLAPYVELASMKHCSSHELCLDPLVITGGVSVDELVGEKSPIYSDSFKALMTADPTDKVWLSLGVTFSNSVSNNGVMYRLTITAKIRLYAPNINTQFFDYQSPLEKEAQRIVFKERKWTALTKENEDLAESYLRRKKLYLQKLEALCEQERKKSIKQ